MPSARRDRRARRRRHWSSPPPRTSSMRRAKMPGAIAGHQPAPSRDRRAGSCESDRDLTPISKLRSAAGAECVSAPIDTIVGAGRGQLRHARQRDAARDLGLRASAALPHRLDDVRRREVVEQDDVGAGLRARRRPRSGSAPRPRSAAPGVAARIRVTALHDAAGQPDVVVLDQNAVVRPKR